jgi:hypothetical protein
MFLAAGTRAIIILCPLSKCKGESGNYSLVVGRSVDRSLVGLGQGTTLAGLGSQWESSESPPPPLRPAAAGPRLPRLRTGNQTACARALRCAVDRSCFAPPPPCRRAEGVVEGGGPRFLGSWRPPAGRQGVCFRGAATPVLARGVFGVPGPADEGERCGRFRFGMLQQRKTLLARLCECGVRCVCPMCWCPVV